MRFAWALRGDAASSAAEAAAAEEAGFDAVWIDGGALEPAALAAHLATATTWVRVGITVPIGGEHPVELAEQVSVADLTLGGRLLLAVRPAPGAEHRLAEALDLLLDCLATHPFRHQGDCWQVPANLPANIHNVEERIRVMPPPAQFELPVWLAGRAGREAAVERGLGVLVDAAEDVEQVGDWWSSARASQPALARRIRRALRWRLTGEAGIDVEATVAGLRTAQRLLDLDVAVVEAPSLATDTPAAMSAVMGEVRPRVQLDRYPPGLEQHWSRSEGSTHG